MAKKITQKQIELILRTPFTVSYGSSSTRTAFLIRTEDGGIGEGTIPFYYGIDFDELKAAWARADETLTSFPETVEAIPGAIEPGIPAPARAALDIAFHDRLGKRFGKPVYALYDLPEPAPMTTSYTISIDTPEAMAEMALSIKDYPCLKVKLGAPGQEDLDEERLRAIRSVRPDAKIRLDANAGWDADGAIALIKRLEKFDLECVEQPTAKDDIEGMGKIQKVTELPIVADESVQTLDDIDRLHEAGVAGINVKLMKCGGIGPAEKMIRRAKSYGMKVMLGCMVETSVGVGAMVQFMGLADWIDLDTPLLISNDPFTGLNYSKNATLLPNLKNGLGISLKPDCSDFFEESK